VTAIGSDVNILAGGDINSNAYQDSQSYSSSSAYVGFSNSLAGGPPTGIKGSDKSGNSTQQVGNTIYALGSNTTNTQNQLRHVDGTLNLLAKSGNITMIGGDYYGDNANLNASQGDIKFIAAKRTAQEESSSGGVQLSMGASASFAGFGASADYGTLDGASASYTVPDALQDQVKNYSSTTSRSSGAANAVDADTRKPQPQTESQAKKMAALQAAGFTSQLDPNDDSVTLANNIFTSGSQNISDTLRNQARMTQSDTSSVSGSASEKTNSGELISAKVGVGIDMAFEKSDATEYTNAQLNVGKKLTVSAGKGSVDIGGIDIGNIDPSGQAHSGTEINISAEEIKSTKYVNTYSNESHSNSTFIGLKAEGHSAIADAAANVATHIVNAVKEKNYKGKDGGGLSASDYAKGRFAAQATIQAVNDAMNLVTGDLIGGSVTMNVGNEHTWKKSNATQENINTITGGNINLQSTRGDITLNGVNISAEDQVILDSARDINVRAAQSTSSEESNTTSVNLSRGAGIGVNAVALATKGDIGPNASVGLSASNTYSRSNTTSYENSSISAGNQVILKSKGDTNLIGANVDSKNVDLDIGGNLNIVSLQDTKVSQSIDVNANVGGGASFSAYTIASPTVSLGGGGGEHHDNYAIVKKQAGIRATEGVSGNVAGDITLTGAYIENQSGQSTLGVGGDVYATQLKDFRDKDGGTGGVNVTIGQNSQKTGKSVQGLGYNFTTDEAIHYEAIQNATIAGVTLQKTWTSTDANGKAVINEDTTNAIKGLENVNTDANNKTVVTRDDYVQGFATGADPLDFLNSLSDIWEYKQKQKKKQPANDDDAPSSPTKKPSAEDPDIDVTPNPAKVPLPVKEPGVEQAPPDSPQPTSESLPDTRPSEPATPAANDATSNNTTVLTTLPPRDTILPSQEKPYVAPKVESETVIPKATTDRGDSFYQEMSTTTANSRFMIDPSDQTLLNSLKNNPNVTQITGSDGSILYTNYDKVVSGIAANDSVFWSNASRSQGDLDAAGNPLSMMAGQDVARQYGANHNGTSLEMAIDKSGIKMPNILDIAPPYAPLLKQIQEQNLQPGTAEYRNAVKDAFKNNKNDPEYQKAANDPNYKAAKDSAYKAWDDISAALARNAKGEVRALLSPDIVQKVTDPNRKPAANDSIFVKTEYDALKNNPNVTKIIAIDPKTYQEIILFDRTQMATPGSKPATETTQPIKDQSVNK
jgi:filamentous hemagglutinin